MLLKDRHAAIGVNILAFDYRLFVRPEYNLILGWGFFSMLGYTVLQFSLPDYAQSLGLTSYESSIIAAVLSLGQAVGRPLVGYFSDSFGRTNMAGLMTFLAGLLSFVCWIFAKSYGSLIICSLLLGCVCGTFWSTIGPVAAEVVGLKELPSSLSILWVLLAFPATGKDFFKFLYTIVYFLTLLALGAEPIALSLRRKTGNQYIDTQIFTGAMYCGGAICMWLLRSWKDHNIVQKYEGSQTDMENHALRWRKSIIHGLIAWKKL